MPLLARGPGFGIKKISVLLALVTYFSMMQYSVRSKILSEKKFFLSTFHRCFRRNFNPVNFQMVSGSVGPDSHTQQLVKGPVIRSLFNHKVEQVIHVWVRSRRRSLINSKEQQKHWRFLSRDYIKQIS